MAHDEKEKEFLSSELGEERQTERRVNVREEVANVIGRLEHGKYKQ